MIAPECQEVAMQAGQWVLVRVNALPEEQKSPHTWPEYAALLVLEKALDAAVLSGPRAAVAEAARAYCEGWLGAIRSRRAML